MEETVTDGCRDWKAVQDGTLVLDNKSQLDRRWRARAAEAPRHSGKSGREMRGAGAGLGSVCVCLLLQYLLHGTLEEPGTLTQGAPVFPGSSRLGIEPKTPGWLVQDPTTSPLDP